MTTPVTSKPPTLNQRTHAILEERDQLKRDGWKFRDYADGRWMATHKARGLKTAKHDSMVETINEAARLAAERTAEVEQAPVEAGTPAAEAEMRQLEELYNPAAVKADDYDAADTVEAGEAGSHAESGEGAERVVYVEASRFERDYTDGTGAQSKGDIAASYSADKIIEGKVRKPFEYDGALYVNTGGYWDSKNIYGCEAGAWRLVPLSEYQGEITTYREKSGPGYEGIRVKWKKSEYVLTGPKVIFKTATDDYQPDDVPASAAPAVDDERRRQLDAACGTDCGHSTEEHDAFDAGLVAGEKGYDEDACPHDSGSLRLAWQSGYDAGKGNRSADPATNGDVVEATPAPETTPVADATPRVFRETVEVKLNDSDVADKARKAARIEVQIEELEAEMKKSKEGYQQKIGGLREEHRELMRAIVRGHDELDLEVYERRDYVRHVVELRRADSCEFISERPMKPTEMQPPLPSI